MTSKLSLARKGETTEFKFFAVIVLHCHIKQIVFTLPFLYLLFTTEVKELY